MHLFGLRRPWNGGELRLPVDDLIRDAVSCPSLITKLESKSNSPHGNSMQTMPNSDWAHQLRIRHLVVIGLWAQTWAGY